MRKVLTLVIAMLAVLAFARPAFAQGFAGLKFGIGLSASLDTGNHDRVDDAEVDPNGIVRVLKTSNALARIMLESHYLFVTKNPKIGVGPFVAVQPGSNEVINALGIGLMLGFRRDTSDQSFNIGIGYSIDPATKILGDGFVENAAAPKGPDSRALPIRYKTVNQGGVLLLTSFTW